MQRLPDMANQLRPPSAVDPCRYVRQADVALLHGNREEARGADRAGLPGLRPVLAICDDITGWGTVWSERNS